MPTRRWRKRIRSSSRQTSSIITMGQSRPGMSPGLEGGAYMTEVQRMTSLFYQASCAVLGTGGNSEMTVGRRGNSLARLGLVGATYIRNCHHPRHDGNAAVVAFPG